MDIRESTLVVTDVETTGTSADDHRILEIGAVKVCDGSIVDRFQQLVNPRRIVPRRITKLTGITTGMVFDAPPVEEVLPSYLDFLGDGILVAHNLSFDKRFLNAASTQTGGDVLPNETLCTLRLARRLLPGLDSKGLDRLVEFYDISVDTRHRALSDAEATSIVLRRFLRQLSFEHELDAPEEVLAFQYRQYQQVREPPENLQRIREGVLPTVPDDPGVYILTNRSGTPLYIGKARCLSNRLRSHFTAIESREGRKREMMEKVHDVEWKTTGTELEALLQESRRIKSEKPRYNRAQRRYYRRPFIRLGVSHEYPTISWTRSLTDDGAEYYGPVRNQEQAETVVDVISRFFELRECDDRRLHLGQRCLYADMDRCTAPCETEDAERYAEVVQQVREFLTGQHSPVVRTLRDRMQSASTEHDFEKAAEYRDTIEQLERVLKRQQILSAPVRRRNAVVVHSGEETVDFHFIRFGRFSGAETVSRPLGEEQILRITEWCASHFDPADERPSSFSKRQVHEIRLLSHWISAHHHELEVVHWSPEQTASELAHEIRKCTSQGDAKPVSP